MIALRGEIIMTFSCVCKSDIQAFVLLAKLRHCLSIYHRLIYLSNLESWKTLRKLSAKSTAAIGKPGCDSSLATNCMPRASGTTIALPAKRICQTCPQRRNSFGSTADFASESHGLLSTFTTTSPSLVNETIWSSQPIRTLVGRVCSFQSGILGVKTKSNPLEPTGLCRRDFR